MTVTTRGGYLVNLYIVNPDALTKGYSSETTRTIEGVWVPRVPVVGEMFVGPEVEGDEYVEDAVSRVEFAYEDGFHEAPVVTVTLGSHW